MIQPNFVILSGPTLSPEQRRLATAVHEAGHAVIAWRNYTLLRENLLIGADLQTGICPVRSAPASMNLKLAREFARQREEYRDSIIAKAHFDIEICLAGPLAERRYRKVRKAVYPGGQQDIQQAFVMLETADALRHGEASNTRIGVMFSMLENLVKGALQKPKTWRAVMAVANELALAGSLTPDRFDELMDVLQPPRNPDAKYLGS